jgi:hypothetical protein
MPLPTLAEAVGATLCGHLAWVVPGWPGGAWAVMGAPGEAGYHSTVVRACAARLADVGVG